LVLRTDLDHNAKSYIICALSIAKGMLVKMKLINVYNDISTELFSYAKEISSPSIIYDFDQLKKVVNTMQKSLFLHTLLLV